MPKEAIDRGAVQDVLPLDRIPAAIVWRAREARRTDAKTA
jgi:chemotaxis response regulator CheB